MLLGSTAGGTAVQPATFEHRMLTEANLQVLRALAADVKSRLQGQLDAWMAQQGDEGLKTELKAKSRQGAGRKTKKPQPKEQ